MRDPYPMHGRRWSIWHPLGWSCRCGLAAYPCSVERSRRRWAAGLAEARDWRDEQRQRWGVR